jgi:hypothetical protein
VPANHIAYPSGQWFKPLDLLGDTTPEIKAYGSHACFIEHEDLRSRILMLAIE